MVEGFLRAAHDRLTALRTAIEDGDAPGVRRIAHALRGSALNLGAVRITAVATALEQADAANARTETNALVDELQTEIQKVEPALLRLLQPRHQPRPTREPARPEKSPLCRAPAPPAQPVRSGGGIGRGAEPPSECQ